MLSFKSKCYLRLTSKLEKSVRLTFATNASEVDMLRNDADHSEDFVKKKIMKKESVIKKMRTTFRDADTLLSKMMLKVKSRKQRDKHGIILLEGKRLIKDAIEAGFVPQLIFFSDKEDGQEFQELNLDTDIQRVPYKSLKLWSTLTTCPGVVAFTTIPSSSDIIDGDDSLPLTVICDEVRDPGNMGSVIRSCAAVGAEQVILMKGCTDPWDPKVLRGGSGGHFRIPLLNEITWQEVDRLLPRHVTVFLADSKSTSENHALSRVSYDKAQPTVDTSSVLIIGNECQGLSQSALKFGTHYKGCCLHIPLVNSVESLNLTAATSILLFELKKKILALSQDQYEQ